MEILSYCNVTRARVYNVKFPGVCASATTISFNHSSDENPLETLLVQICSVTMLLVKKRVKLSLWSTSNSLPSKYTVLWIRMLGEVVKKTMVKCKEQNCLQFLREFMIYWVRMQDKGYMLYNAALVQCLYPHWKVLGYFLYFLLLCSLTVDILYTSLNYTQKCNLAL